MKRKFADCSVLAFRSNQDTAKEVHELESLVSECKTSGISTAYTTDKLKKQLIDTRHKMHRLLQDVYRAIEALPMPIDSCAPALEMVQGIAALGGNLKILPLVTSRPRPHTMIQSRYLPYVEGPPHHMEVCFNIPLGADSALLQLTALRARQDLHHTICYNITRAVYKAAVMQHDRELDNMLPVQLCEFEALIIAQQARIFASQKQGDPGWLALAKRSLPRVNLHGSPAACHFIASDVSSVMFDGETLNQLPFDAPGIASACTISQRFLLGAAPPSLDFGVDFTTRCRSIEIVDMDARESVYLCVSTLLGASGLGPHATSQSSVVDAELLESLFPADRPGEATHFTLGELWSRCGYREQFRRFLHCRFDTGAYELDGVLSIKARCIWDTNMATKHNWVEMARHNIPVPVSFLVFRLKFRVETRSAVLMETHHNGYVLVTDADISVNRDAVSGAGVTQRIECQVVVPPEGYETIMHARATGYAVGNGGGVSCRVPIGPGRDVTDGDLFICAVPYDFTPASVHTDITGFPSPVCCSRDYGDAASDYPTAAYYTARYSLGGPSDSVLHIDAKPNDHEPTLAIQACQRNYNPETSQWDLITKGSDAFGERPDLKTYTDQLPMAS